MACQFEEQFGDSLEFKNRRLLGSVCRVVRGLAGCSAGILLVNACQLGTALSTVMDLKGRSPRLRREVISLAWRIRHLVIHVQVHLQLIEKGHHLVEFRAGELWLQFFGGFHHGTALQPDQVVDAQLGLAI